ncbi:MAG: hypothetical protein EA366_08340 [Spirulina sp. DLM2.Bin59]|nr:MAG: hypothetical protein EA366_08340 [Spirulina sp. DLM2.Bin59]
MQRLRQRSLALFSSSLLLVSLWGSAAWAGDPFRGNNNPSNIGNHTEAAFNSMFRDGDYRRAMEQIQRALQSESSDPLAPAIRAALAYNMDADFETMRRYADTTRTAAQALLNRPNASPQDQLRGNLYLAAAVFMEGTYNWETNKDYVAAALRVQEVFSHLNRADRINNEAGLNDPELGLVKGYIELLLAVNLPMSSPENAIAQFQATARPTYLVDRGIAIAYRDIGNKAGRAGKAEEARTAYRNGLRHINQSLSVTPNNPELFYLKAQILHEMGKVNQGVAQTDPTASDRTSVTEAVALFDRALAQGNQLPPSMLPQIQRERDIAQQWLNTHF